MFGTTVSDTGIEASFNGFPAHRMNNGDYVIKGSHYEEFIRDYYNPDSQTFEACQYETVETVSVDQIEGIHLSDTDIDNPDGFWSMHSSSMHDSSKDFFVETASHIPEVKTSLDSGKTLEELIEDPVLGTCTSLYFDPANIPRVEKNEGYYTFGGDGRHRLIIAKEFGYEIPVRVMGIRRTRND